MDIAALSMGLSQMKVTQQASILVMKMTMDSAKGQAVDMAKLLEENTNIIEQSVNPHIGENMDISLQRPF